MGQLLNTAAYILISQTVDAVIAPFSAEIVRVIDQKPIVSTDISDYIKENFNVILSKAIKGGSRLLSCKVPS
jgi:hypothetical protein